MVDGNGAPASLLIHPSHSNKAQYCNRKTGLFYSKLCDRRQPPKIVWRHILYENQQPIKKLSTITYPFRTCRVPKKQNLKHFKFLALS